MLILDRMVDARRLEWSRWVILLAAGGFAGNFVLSLADHAQNGFFYPTRVDRRGGRCRRGRLPVAAVIVPDSRSLLAMNLGLMVVQVVVGLLGFYLHAVGNLGGRIGPALGSLRLRCPDLRPAPVRRPRLAGHPGPLGPVAIPAG